MLKKRKSAAAGPEEVDRTMYSAFCTAANSLSQLYSYATNHQKLSFQAGERHALVADFGLVKLAEELDLNKVNFAKIMGRKVNPDASN